jgi:DNA-binding beta-propeller fold protein YncE
MHTPSAGRHHGARIVAAILLAAVMARPAAGTFATFESGQVRPLALSPDGTRLFALNTPDNQLEIFAVTGGSLTHVGAVAVGLEPVAVAARTDTEVWVVNHLSDSVSIVDVGATPPHVVRTLLVGDEPRDIVFAGQRDAGGHFSRAFITTARRGQNLPAAVPPKLTTPGTPRALVWVFDATTPNSTPGSDPEAIIELFGDTPRALAATPDGHSVFAAIFHSGNQTTSVTEGAVCDGGASAASCPVDTIQVPGGLPGGRAPGGLPAPTANAQGIIGPETGLIVKLNRDSGLWEDGLGRNWTNAVRFNLPDDDVFKIDALASPPVQTAAFAHVGTVLFNMVVNPSNGTLYVSNTEAHNDVRFEGAGTNATTVRGHLHEARITVIDGARVRPRHLNKHITALPQGYRTTPMPARVKAASLATPVDMVMAHDGTLYVAAFGSSAVGTFAAGALEDDTFTPNAADHIAVSGGGPAGLAPDESSHRLYVLTRFDNAVTVIDTTSKSEIAHHPLHNPEPAAVIDGRRFLYDARVTSSNGEASCSSCHVFGDFDSLAWDLGNPDAVVTASPNPIGPIGGAVPFHPLKGPMTTQTLRGLAHQGPMHWRGDRTGGAFPNDPNALDTQRAFATFNVAFDALLGRDEGPLSDADMQAFATFALRITAPPNPIRNLDNQLTAAQAHGRDVYINQPVTDAITNCNGCHTLDPSRGFFGTGGLTTFETETQEFKIPHLNNAYQKIGMFGTPSVAFAQPALTSRQFQGDQIRGFGFLHDGSIARLIDFLHAGVFSLDDDARSGLEQFILAYDTTFAPIVGQQVTVSAGSGAAAGPRLDLMIARATTDSSLVGQIGARECDLIVKGVVNGEARGYLLNPASGQFQSDRATEAALSDAQLRAVASAPGQELTYTCTPPGSGRRAGLDRDGDGHLDRDEIDAGTDPVNADDPPGTGAGDCNHDGRVTIDELITGVNIALGSSALADCPSFDTDGDAQVSIDELIQAVTAALATG